MKTILIVDDQEPNLYMLRVLLEGNGFAVSSARNGIEALETARREAPDLVISDILMPGMDGFTLCREWMADAGLKGIPLMFYTATYTDAKDEEFALSLGAERFVVKPTEPDTLMAVVREVLEESSERVKASAEAAEPPPQNGYFERYSQVLIRKLEDKMMQLEKTNRALELDIAARRLAEESLARRAAQLVVINEVGRQVSALLDLGEILDGAARLMQDRFGFDHVALLTRSETEDGWVVRAMASRYSHLFPATATIPAGRGMIGWVGLRGETRLSGDVRSDPMYFDPNPGKVPTRSELTVPICVGQDVVGVLDLQSPETDAFDEDDVTTAETLAAQIAVAINNARLYTQVAERNRQLTLLNRVIATTSAAVDRGMDPMLQIVCREMVQAFEVPWATASVFDPGRNERVVVAEYVSDRVEKVITSVRHTRVGEANPVEGDLVSDHLLARRSHLVLNGDEIARPSGSGRDTAGEGTVGTRLFVPLVVDERVVGCLELDAVHPRLFSSARIGLARRVAEQVSGVLAMMGLRDERKRLEDQFHQSQKMEAIGRLAGGVAHDFNNLLTVVDLSIRILEDELDGDDPNWVHLRAIEDASRRAAGLTRQLLVFSRREIAEPQRLDLNEVLDGMGRVLGPLLGEDVDVSVKEAEDLWPIEIDPTQIEQVVLNLAVNARDAMPGGGSLTIETANVVLDRQFCGRHLEAIPGEYVSLAVNDSGVGMTEDVKARVFEPFFTTKARGKGTGLGLATVHGIVRQNRGYVLVESELGRGSTFTAFFPRFREAEQKTAPAIVGEEAPERGLETILVVEDQEHVRDVTRLILKRQGYTVLAAEDGVDALRIAGEHEGVIDLLLTDMVLPTMSGRTLADELQGVRPDMRVLFMSGYSDEMIGEHGSLAGGNNFLPKPYSRESLTRKVRAVLDGGEPNAATGLP